MISEQGLINTISEKGNSSSLGCTLFKKKDGRKLWNGIEAMEEMSSRFCLLPLLKERAAKQRKIKIN